MQVYWGQVENEGSGQAGGEGYRERILGETTGIGGHLRGIL